MKFQVLTLFPEAFESFMTTSIIGKAREKQLIDVECIDIRAFSNNKHHKVDDVPFGGGAGMVMAPQPLFDAIEQVQGLSSKKAPVIFFTPSVHTFNQPMAESFAKGSWPPCLPTKGYDKIDRIILVCGRYEGIDQRVRDTLIDAEISMGQFILTGGELASQIFIDAVSRLIPGVLGKVESHEEESFSSHLGRNTLEYPHYTRPEEFRGLKVPEVLLSGHHANIEKWRVEQCQKIDKNS